MKIEFTVQGEPKGKGRPRFTKSGHTYTPRSTAEYEDIVKYAYISQCRREPFAQGVPLCMEISAVFKIPKSASRKRRAAMLNGDILPTKKPDADNVVKIIADALNGLAYYDDAQIVRLKYAKVYGEIPQVTVKINAEERTKNDENRLQ